MKFRYLELFSEKSILAYISLKIDIFRSAMCYYVLRWPIFMIVVSIERRDPTLYYGTKQLYFGLVNFKFTGGGKHPLGRRVTKKKKKKKAQEDKG